MVQSACGPPLDPAKPQHISSAAQSAPSSQRQAPYVHDVLHVGPEGSGQHSSLPTMHSVLPHETSPGFDGGAGGRDGPGLVGGGGALVVVVVADGDVGASLGARPASESTGEIRPPHAVVTATKKRRGPRMQVHGLAGVPSVCRTTPAPAQPGGLAPCDSAEIRLARSLQSVRTMKSARLVSLVLGPSLLLSAWACGGKEVTSKQSSSSTAGSAADASAEKATRGDDAPAAASDAGPAPDCVHSNQSGSGGGGNGSYSCTTTHEYTCTSGEKSITCDCTGQNGGWSPGTCSCNGITFAFDCANACTVGAAEFAKCGLPEPPPDPPSGGGSSSSSGGT